MERHLHGARIYLNGSFVRADLLIRDGMIADISTVIDAPRAEVVSLDGLVLFPGLTDVHVHFREPGFLYKETVASGSAAAAHGGFTTVFTMPNLSPAPDSAENLLPQLEAIRRDGRVRVLPYGTITVGQRGEALSDLEGLSPDVIAFTDDGRGVQDRGMMREAMKRAKALGKTIVAHCEDNSLLRGGVIHDGAYARANGIPGICSESEWRQVERDLCLVEETGCAYHVCHVSSKESVSLIREAKRAGLDVTCETGPHYLTLSDADLRDEGRFKMNPPLRDASDREALLEGLADGTVDMIATDHAPHSAEEKSKGLRGSLMGVVGLETAFPVLYTELVLKGRIPLSRVIDAMTEAPARRFGLSGGRIGVGMPADLFAVDLEKSYRIDPSRFLSMGRATPFEGMHVFGEIQMTLVGGKTVYAAEKLRND